MTKASHTRLSSRAPAESSPRIPTPRSIGNGAASTGGSASATAAATSGVRNPMSESAYPYPARYGGSAISIVPLVVVIAAVIASTAMKGRAMVGMVAHYVGVKTETVEFYSEGARLRGFLHRPDAAADRLPFIVQGPGWLGLADAKLYAPYHEAFTDAGFAVLIFDYRGFGERERDRVHARAPRHGARARRDLRQRRHGRRQRGPRCRGGARDPRDDQPGPCRGWTRLAASDATRARVGRLPRGRGG